MRGNRPGGRNATDQAQLITIYWRDIPAQVTARAGRRKAGVQLPDEFQVAIDRAAVVAGKHTTDEYLAEWRRVASPCDGDLNTAAEAAAAALQAEFPPQRLKRLVANGGVDPDEDPT
jgi:hypothetical protein